ncbi:hypothetical protein E0493_01030 [Roseomonas sp. M0104]|uniref:Uncharacterized protein n=1 Tax=Teichococcus coralli TaxID=2545983 RepID=A0A845B962_9PROT|nr:hypothetical protein [Pseudoroseomonas coralli]MXP61932.1 hypothetical protein [Pseudoroseomonas coralli]
MAFGSAATGGLSPALPLSTLPLSTLPPSTLPATPPGLLATDRLLDSATALFDLVQRLLGTVVGRVCGARIHMEALARPGTAPEAWAEALLRYRQVAADIQASLVATHDIGLSLLEAGLEDGFGLADSLSMLEQIATQMPPVPADADTAQGSLEALGEMVASIAVAQARFAAGQRRVEARMTLWADEGAEIEPGPLLLGGTDLQKEAVRLQALQVRQQLAGHSIGLGALMPRCLQELGAA